MKLTIFMNMDVEKVASKFDTYFGFLRWAVWYKNLKENNL